MAANRNATLAELGAGGGRETGWNSGFSCEFHDWEVNEVNNVK